MSCIAVSVSLVIFDADNLFPFTTSFNDASNAYFANGWERDHGYRALRRTSIVAMAENRRAA